MTTKAKRATRAHRANRAHWGIIMIVFREHDIIVINKDGNTENITKFPFGPEHNIVPC